MRRLASATKRFRETGEIVGEKQRSLGTIA